MTLHNLPLPPRIYPLFNNSMRPSQNLLLPPRIYPFQQMYNMCDPLRIYLFLPGYTPPLFNNYMRPSQNIPFPLRIYPPFQQMYMCDPPKIYPSLPPSQNTPPFSTTKCDLPRIYPTFNNYNIMRCSQNLPLPPRIYPPPFSTTIYDPPRIYPSLPEYTHFSTTILLYHSPRIYPPLHLSQNIPPLPFNNYMRHSQKLPLPRRTPPPLFRQLYAPSLSEYIPPHLSTTICDIPRT